MFDFADRPGDEVSSFPEYLRSLRRDLYTAAERRVAIFQTLPLFVLVAWNMDETSLNDAYLTAINDGYGDPEDLDPDDAVQTARLETAILEILDADVSMTELLQLQFQWADDASLILVEWTHASFLVLYEPGRTPSFHAFAAGSSEDLLLLLVDEPETVVPRVECVSWGVTLVRVIVCHGRRWSGDTILRVVEALTAQAVGLDSIEPRSSLLLPAATEE